MDTTRAERLEQGIYDALFRVDDLDSLLCFCCMSEAASTHSPPLRDYLFRLIEAERDCRQALSVALPRLNLQSWPANEAVSALGLSFALCQAARHHGAPDAALVEQFVFAIHKVCVADCMDRTYAAVALN